MRATKSQQLVKTEFSGMRLHHPRLLLSYILNEYYQGEIWLKPTSESGSSRKFGLSRHQKVDLGRLSGVD